MQKKSKTSFPVDCLASENNTNIMARKLQEFGFQFTPVKWDMSNNFFKRQSSKPIATAFLSYLWLTKKMN